MAAQQPLPFSFEYFPPKTNNGHLKLQQTAATLAALEPAYFSVTYGAGGSTQERTLATVRQIHEATGVDTAPHISCINSTRTAIAQLLDHYRQHNVRRLVVLRGDQPADLSTTSDEFNHANELVSYIRETTGTQFHIEVAAYPEFHPETQHAQQGLQYFKQKIDAGADGAITQYFYNADAYFYFRDACVKLGIDVPIVAGIMPITNYKQLARFSDCCGAEIPRWLRRRLESCNDDIDAITRVGEDVVTQLCERLIAGGVPGLHFYTLNKAEPSFAILKQLGLVNYRLVESY